MLALVSAFRHPPPPAVYIPRTLLPLSPAYPLRFPRRYLYIQPLYYIYYYLFIGGIGGSSIERVVKTTIYDTPQLGVIAGHNRGKALGPVPWYYE